MFKERVNINPLEQEEEKSLKEKLSEMRKMFHPDRAGNAKLIRDINELYYLATEKGDQEALKKFNELYEERERSFEAIMKFANKMKIFFKLRKKFEDLFEKMDIEFSDLSAIVQKRVKSKFDRIYEELCKEFRIDYNKDNFLKIFNQLEQELKAKNEKKKRILVDLRQEFENLPEKTKNDKQETITFLDKKYVKLCNEFGIDPDKGHFLKILNKLGITKITSF